MTSSDYVSFDPFVVHRSDGCTIAWYEFGAPDGEPCFYMPGTPEAGIGGAIYDEAAKAHGVRWISLDKPGYGASSEQPGRLLTDWAGDVKLVVDHLGIDRFAVAGESGGGPHALVVAWGLRTRVTGTILLASSAFAATRDVGPTNQKKTNRKIGELLRNDRAALIELLEGWRAAFAAGPKSGEELLRQLLAEAPEYDQRAMLDPVNSAIFVAAEWEAFRPGINASLREMEMSEEEWGFELSEITSPVVMWHGTADVNVPIQIGRAIAAELPSVTLNEVQGGGHLVGINNADAVMDTVIALAGNKNSPK